jgi:HSP20 family protein
MSNDERSFFEKLTGEPSEDTEKEEDKLSPQAGVVSTTLAVEDNNSEHDGNKEWLEEVEDHEGQLTVDVYQTPSHIVIQAPMAGVKPDDVDVSITQDMVTIRGERTHHDEAKSDDHYYQELYWGLFSRSILLPEEVDSDNAEASFKHGLLTVKLPKLKKMNTQKVKIKKEDDEIKNAPRAFLIYCS